MWHLQCPNCRYTDQLPATPSSRRHRDRRHSPLSNGGDFNPPPPPGPAPVPDPPANFPRPDNVDSDSSRQPVRSDGFYRAWDRFYRQPVLPKHAKQSKSLDFDANGRPSHDQSCNEDGVTSSQNAVTSYDQAVLACRSKVEAIVKECRRLNVKYTDRIFNCRADCFCSLAADDVPSSMHKLYGFSAIQRIEEIFDKPVFIKDDATGNNVKQGGQGDCWLLSGIVSLFGAPHLLKKLFVARDEQVGVYGFVFYRDGEWISEVVDDYLPLKCGDARPQHLMTFASQDASSKTSYDSGVDMTWTPIDKEYRESLRKGSKALYFASCRDSEETWLPLLEKAYAKIHGDYQALEGGFPGEAIEDLTGGVCTKLNSATILDKDKFWKELKQVNEEYLFCVTTPKSPSPAGTENNVINAHCYTVLEVRELDDLRLLKLRNPWAKEEWKGAWSDGSKEWTAARLKELNHTFGDDGIFWIAYKDFLSHFRSIDRTKLFGPDWTLTQQWTSVVVGPTSSYLGTYFSLKVPKSGPTVIALSQPDTRYFKGLQGRYEFTLHFRVYKQGEETYLCRSMQTSGGDTRSCNVEIDLEAGEYSIHIKVTAERDLKASTIEEVIRKNRKDDKAKLIEVGKRFDMVASKGKLRELERALEKKRKRKDREDELERQKARRKARKARRDRYHKKQMKKEAEHFRKIEEIRERRRKILASQKKSKDKHKRRAKEIVSISPPPPPLPLPLDTEVIILSDSPKSTSRNPLPSIETESVVQSLSNLHFRHEPLKPFSPPGPTALPTPAPSRSPTGVGSNPTSPAARTASGTAQKPTIPPTTSPSTPRARSRSRSRSPSKSRGRRPQRRRRGPPPPAPAGEDSDVSEIGPPVFVNDVSDVQSDDFDWDSELDGWARGSSNSDEDLYSSGFSSSSESEADSDDEERGRDPWNATLVLGLRVYSKTRGMVIGVEGDSF